jgi:ribosomal protein S18 acetylase RimI-like enzyme
MSSEALRPALWAPERAAELAGQIARSDSRYFSLGAGLSPLPGAVLAAVEGLTSLPAGCVVLVLDADAAGRDARGWVRSAEAAIVERGGRMARVYLDAPAPPLERALGAMGYQRRVEDIFLTPPGPAPGPGDVRLVPVQGRFWTVARELHASDALAPDGYPASAEDWWELMRRKQEAGGMECYLIESGGRLRGTVGIVPMPDVLRIKNVFVAPSGRGNGVGRAVVRAVWRSAGERGRCAAGVLGVRGTPGAALYASAGLRTEGALVEWSRRLERS